MRRKPSVVPFAFLFFLVFSLAPGSGHGSPPQGAPVSEAPGEVRLDLNYLKGYVNDTARIVTAPARWREQEWLTAAALSSAVVVLYAYDQDIRDWTLRRRGVTTDLVSRYTKPLGEGWYTLPALGLFGVYGYAVDDQRPRRAALLGVESFVISGVFTQVLKYATHRHTPDESGRYDKWDGPSFSSDRLSFPSGHAQTAFSIATVIASEYDHAAVAPVAYGLAALTALSRVNDDCHWASDVLVGSLIGYFTAKAVVGLHRKKGPWGLTPARVGRGAGLAASYRF